MKRYEFCFLRYMDNPTAGEFANIGVIMLDRDSQRLDFRVSERYRRVSDFFAGVNGNAFRALVRGIERTLENANEAMLQPTLLSPAVTSLGELVTTIFPNDESSITLSETMFGVSEDPTSRLNELFDEFVRRYELSQERPRRDEADVRRDLDRAIIHSGLSPRITFEYPIQSSNYQYVFHAAWQNGQQQVLEPISFDLSEPTRIVEKATSWAGRLYNLSKGAEFAFNTIVAPPTEPTNERAFDRALAILGGAPKVRSIVLESNTENVLSIIRGDTDNAASPLSRA